MPGGAPLQWRDHCPQPRTNKDAAVEWRTPRGPQREAFGQLDAIEYHPEAFWGHDPIETVRVIPRQSTTTPGVAILAEGVPLPERCGRAQEAS